MTTDNGVKFETMSEADFEPVLELLQGGDPEAIARKAGISKERLFQIRDDLLAHVERERAKAAPAASKPASLKKIGRNDPCPCGSGKKYKHCCMDRKTAATQASASAATENNHENDAEQEQLVQRIEKLFGLLAAGRHSEAIEQTGTLITRYPNEDRLHDIVAIGHLYAGEYVAAIEICKQRLAVAESQKAFYIEHGRYEDADNDAPQLSYYYPPLTWLQKYWIALKTKEYNDVYPSKENAVIVGLVKALQSADDAGRFSERQDQGLDQRRTALKEPLEQLKSIGSEVIPYLLPLAVRYNWTGIFVPEILSAYSTDLAIRTLIDISMFGFAYASGASLHYLQIRGETVIPSIEAAFSRDKKFDPIKTGIVSVLGNIRTPAAYEVLLGLLEHESPHIVNWAGDALGKFDNPDVLPAMVAASDRIGGEQMIENAILRLKDLENSA